MHSAHTIFTTLKRFANSHTNTDRFPSGILRAEINTIYTYFYTCESSCWWLQNRITERTFQCDAKHP